MHVAVVGQVHSQGVPKVTVPLSLSLGKCTTPSLSRTGREEAGVFSLSLSLSLSPSLSVGDMELMGTF